MAHATPPTDFLLTTPRLGLRPWTLADAPALYRLNADPEVLRYTGDTPFASEAAAAAFIEAYDHYDRHGFGRWAVVRRSDGAFLGWCGLKRHVDGMVDLGFRLMRAYWGKGYATEAAAASLSYALGPLRLEEVIGRAMPENRASVRILTKLGMTYWKTDACGDFAGAAWYRISAPGTGGAP
ncbi:MAG: N-acetyltransferase [Bacteroidetes bacterium]|nr:MAG: N-acetyltransferase [Bacteroidota bacterium]